MLTVLVVLAVTGLLALGVDVPSLIGVLGFATLAVALTSIWLLPETLFKDVIRLTLRLAYRVEVKGLEHMPRQGEKAVVVVNHLSFLDGVHAGRLSAWKADLCRAHRDCQVGLDQAFSQAVQSLPGRSHQPDGSPRRW